MTERHLSSRRRFEKQKVELSEQISLQGRQGRKQRDRSSWDLMKSFLRLLRFHRGSMLISLLTLTLATCFALVPPASTKFIIDNVMGEQPLPAWLPDFVPSDS